MSSNLPVITSYSIHYTKLYDWEKVYGDIYADIGYSVIEVSTGGYLITGTSEMDPGTSGLDVLLVRTDTDGNLLWQSYVGGSYDQYSYNFV